MRESQGGNPTSYIMFHKHKHFINIETTMAALDPRLGACRRAQLLAHFLLLKRAHVVHVPNQFVCVRVRVGTP